jgi:hypothetical protein
MRFVHVAGQLLLQEIRHGRGDTAAVARGNCGGGQHHVRPRHNDDHLPPRRGCRGLRERALAHLAGFVFTQPSHLLRRAKAYEKVFPHLVSPLSSVDNRDVVVIARQQTIQMGLSPPELRGGIQ